MGAGQPAASPRGDQLTEIFRRFRGRMPRRPCKLAPVEARGRMGTRIELSCRCGEVRGVVADPSPRTVNRVVCYCDDCQAFAHRLGRADLLNAHGGTDVVQVAPATLSFTQGQDRIRGVRLSPKGLYRWYADCCNTPVGNTMSPAIPFVGIIASGFDHGTQRADDAFGLPVGAVQGKFAIGEPPAGSK